MTNEEMKELFRQGWKEVLQVEEVTDESDFFAAGGNSIMAVQLPSWLIQKGIKLDMMDIFMTPTFGELAGKLKETDPLYVPEEVITKEIAAREMGFANIEDGEKAERFGMPNPMKMPWNMPAPDQKDGQVCTPEQKDGQVCTPEQKDGQVCTPEQKDGQVCTPDQKDGQVCTPTNQQVCTPEQKDSQVCTPASQQICTPEQKDGQVCTPTNQQICTPAAQQNGSQVCTPTQNDSQVCTPAAQQICSPASQQICTPASQQICTPVQSGWQFFMPFQMGWQVCTPMPIQSSQICTPVMQQAGGQVCTPAMQGSQGYSVANAQNIPPQLQRYFPKQVDQPIENPKVVKINEVKVAEKKKDPATALMDVLKGILPSFDKNKDFFEQGISSLDTVKMVTRCGEAGYKLEMKDIYMHSTFDELLPYLK